MQSIKNEFDVVIVGGGPVGLWLACELALAKVEVAVIERRAERVTQSRGLTVHGRTLETFALRGIADRFTSRGRLIPRTHFGVLETLLDLSECDSSFPFMLLLPQATTEELLKERALELGVEVRRGELVETVQPDVDGVIVQGQGSGYPFRCYARYVIGADGARSLVRKAAGIEFQGYPARHTMMLGDVILDAPPSQPLLTRVNEAGGLLVAPLGDGIHYRLGVIDTLSTSVLSTESVTLSELATVATRIAGVDLCPRDPVWLSRFTDETRLAEHYRKGRILLAGDAAHINAPMGGQGMNVGIQDAMNLGWKLASVVHGTAPETLLDTYERERLPVGEGLRQDTLAQFALFASFDPSALALRRLFDQTLRISEVNRRLVDQVTGFGVAYPEPLFPPDRGWAHQSGKSGQRVPDMDLVLKDGSTKTLYSLFESGRWVQLQLEAEAKLHQVDNNVTTVDLAVGANDSLLAPFASVLVRPDGYLAHVLPTSELRVSG